jgi:hypothetical protein
MQGGFWKCGQKIKEVRRSEQGKRRKGFKPDAAAGPTRKPGRNHIRLRRGGNILNIENQPSFRKMALNRSVPCKTA